jgi:hypothetical protein
MMASQEGEPPVLIRKIEKFLRQHDMPPTKFGRLAAHDPRFVLDLRIGRTPRDETAKRIEHFMNIYNSGKSAAKGAA